MPHSVYKLFHLLGIFMTFLSLGGLLLYAINGGTKEQNTWRKPVAITHGVGVVLLLVSGFGMLARLGMFWPLPGWAIVKIVIWLILGGMTAFIYKGPDTGKTLWFIVLLLGVIAAYLATMKPF